MDYLAFDRFKAGDERVLTLYFDKHVKALLLFAYRLVADVLSSEELVQDAYIKLWDQRDSIENESHLKSFLYQVIYQGGIDLLRKSNRFQPNEAIDDTQDLLLDPTDTPLAKIIHVEVLQLVYKEVSKLPKRQQLVFKLSIIEGLTTEEITRQLGINANAVFIAKSKALAHLKRIFKDRYMVLILSSLLFPDELPN